MIFDLKHQLLKLKFNEINYLVNSQNTAVSMKQIHFIHKITSI